ncbi:MAG: PilZ domain-containing protein [Spirochaetales bacterium]|nr:PilZ domain-containing protein [Spirochaetales bacterium]
MWILIIILIIGAALLLLNRSSGKVNRLQIIRFYSKGKDAGFKWNEISLLWKAAVLAEVDVPTKIYFSLDELDNCINIINRKYGVLDRKNHSDPAIRELVGKLFDYRKKVEFSKPRYKRGLKTTRDIPLNQFMKIRTSEAGIHTTTVCGNTDTYVVISYPKGEPVPIGFTWRGRVLNIYFWRDNDAGYFFQSRLIDSYKDSDNKYFRMAHTDHLLRSQKRRSVRAEAQFAAQMYRFKSTASFNNDIETNPGLFCVITDVSEDGAAVRVGGRGKKGMALKLQFKIRENLIVVNGVVKSVNYNYDKDQSILHIELMPLEESAKFAVLSYVYDVDRSRKRKQAVVEEHKRDRQEKIAGEMVEVEEIAMADDSE